MPPPETGKRLTAEQVETLRSWIEQGARWEKHWAYVTPERPELPGRSEGRSDHPVDRLLEARREPAGLTPAPQADPATLLRRLSLDLTGLPPSLDDLEAHLRDPGPQAYERAVDRLMSSVHYAERMSVYWLDLGALPRLGRLSQGFASKRLALSRLR